MKNKSIISVLILIILIMMTSCDNTAKVPASSDSTTNTLPDESDVINFENNDNIHIDKQFVAEIGTVKGLPDASKRRYTFRSLTVEEQKAYEKMYVAISNFEPSVKFENGISFRTFQKIYPLIYLQEGQLFWLSGVYDIFDDKKYEIELNYIMSEENAGYATKIINRKTKELLSGINTDEMTQGEIAMFMHDYVVENVEYDKVGSAVSQSIYGSFIDGVAQTQGYVKLYNFLCINANPDIDAILSKGISNTGNSYSWSIVRLDNEWYNTDLVMNDTDDGTIYNYFNVTDDEILNKTHFQDLSYFVPPECKGEKYNYFRQGGFEADTYQQAFSMLKQSLIEQSPETKGYAAVRFSDREVYLTTKRHLIDENGISAVIKSATRKTDKTIDNDTVTTNFDDSMQIIGIIVEYK